MSARRMIRIGTRGSKLALAQSGGILKALKKKFPAYDFSLVVIKTKGDEFQGVELFKKNGVGVFTKAIEEALLKRRVDLAVHSLKDLPTKLPKGLCLAAVPRRLDARDVLISRGAHTLKTLPRHSRVGTGSPRRKRQLELLRPDLELVDMRGNLDTRVGKVLKEKSCDAVVVARAGLLRLKKYLNHARAIALSEIMPAVGQAALGLEARVNDAFMCKLLKKLNHAETETGVAAERIFLDALKGGCRVPVGVLSRIQKGNFYMKAAVYSTRSNAYVAGEVGGPARRSQILARQLAKNLLRRGAARFLKEART